MYDAIKNYNYYEFFPLQFVQPPSFHTAMWWWRLIKIISSQQLEILYGLKTVHSQNERAKSFIMHF